MFKGPKDRATSGVLSQAVASETTKERELMTLGIWPCLEKG